jgi:hypothetical protein
MKVYFYIIIALVTVTVLLNLLLLIDVKLIGYFRWVNAFTGFSLVGIVLLTWLAKRCINKQKTNYVHKIFSKN